MVKSEAAASAAGGEYVNSDRAAAAAGGNSEQDAAISTSPVTADQLAYMHHHRYQQNAGATDAAAATAAAEYMPTVIGATANYGNSYGYGNYGNSCGTYLNSPAMASFLYPHLYSSMPGLHAAPPIHGNGQLSAAHANDASGAMDEYILSDNPNDASAVRGDPIQQAGDTSGYSSLEGGTGGTEEGQTGPIRGAYSQRSEHGAHVWRPY
jgi:hypothetical protein